MVYSSANGPKRGSFSTKAKQAFLKGGGGEEVCKYGSFKQQQVLLSPEEKCLQYSYTGFLA